MSERLAVGIDFGTSMSLIATYQNGKPWVIPDPGTQRPNIPSLVALDEEGQLHVGEAAQSWADLPGHGVREVKRILGSGQTITLRGKTYRPEELAATIIRYLLRNAEEALGRKIDEAVLSVPANFPDTARQATLAAGELAGIKIQRLINEPTAAALAYGINRIDEEAQVIVFDFGGGTLDVTTLEMFGGIMDVKASHGDPHLGGRDMDEALMNLILRKFREEAGDVTVSDRAMTQLKTEAEKAKILLSTEMETVVRMPAFAVQGGSPIDLNVHVTREEFNREIAPLLQRARQCIRHALDAKEIRPSKIDKVLLVGGTTYIPAVRQLVAEMFALEPERSIDPDLAVAKGVAVQSAMVHGMVDSQRSLILTDVAPYGLGIPVVSIVGGQPMLVYDELMPPNTTIPYSTTRSYSLLDAEQDAVTVQLYQDHYGKARFPEDAEFTGIEGRITGIPPSETGEPHPLELEFSYDMNGLAQVRARIASTGQSVTIQYAHSAVRLTPEEKQEAQARVDELWRQSPEAGQYEAVIRRAEELLPTVPAFYKADLESVLTALKDALASGNKRAIDDAGSRLVDLLYDVTSELGG